MPSAEEQLALFRANYAAWNGCEGRIRVILGPRAPQRCSAALLAGATELSERYGVPVHTHVLETRTQAVTAQMQHGCTLIAFMRDLGC
jgi:cytosine/adenosine deaminase-related metal-dependent hydrolase